MRPLQTKSVGKICQGSKKIKYAVMYGWGKQIFPQSPKENKNSLNKLVNKLMQQNISSLFTKAFYQCCFMCDRKTNPNKLVSADCYDSDYRGLQRKIKTCRESMGGVVY